MLAMQAAGIEVDRYVAFEIDKYAVQTSSHNFPMIEHRGDVFQADFTEFSGFDFLVGGSPCTYWSIAQKNNRETEASGLVSAQNRQRLYWVGKRNPDGTYSKVHVEQPEDRGILLRDVLDGVTDREKGRLVLTTIGRTTTREYLKKYQGNMAFEPVASTVLNVNPSGKGMNGSVGRIDAKSRCLTTNKGEGQKIIVPVAEPVCVAERGRYGADGIEQHYEVREDGKTNVLTTVQKDNQVCEPVRVGTYPNEAKNKEHDSQQYRIYSAEGKGVTLCGNGGGMGAKTGLYAVPLKVGEIGNGGQGNRIYSVDGKSVSQTATSGGIGSNTGLYAIPIEFDGDVPTKAISGADGKTYPVYQVKDGQITIKGKSYPIKLEDGFYIIRKLTVSECKRLQTVPEWYEFPVSDTQAYKMLGNGWTVEVIAHLINATQADELEEPEEQISLFK
jgi:DNA (cytosine-5)-methyltransferase 3A